MISFIILLITLFLVGGWLFATRSKMYEKISNTDRYSKDERPYNNQFSGVWLVKPVLLLIIGLLVSLFQPWKLERIDAGHVGVQVNLSGVDRGVSAYNYVTGWVPYNSWAKDIKEIATFQQHIEYDPQTITMKGGYTTTITPSFNYAVISEAAGDMYVNLRVDLKQIEQGWLKNAIIGSVNDAANRWTVDSLFNHREAFENSIVAECNKRVSKWFKVSQLRSNILPPPALAESIAAKTKAIQDAQTALQKALVAEANGKIKIATARADSAELVIGASGRAKAEVEEAKGTAEAMRLKQQQITPLYNDYIRANTWDGKLPTTILGGNTSSLFNLK
jgi:regulator of protease activity HflC (stomatin/prohibitin superfamily)